MGIPLYVTYCAADKDPAVDLLPAAWRYRSTRIDAVLARAVVQAAAFRILSGRYGLLAPGDPIPWYDHELTDEEVPRHAALVARQLGLLEPEAVVYHTRSADADPGTIFYRRCMEEACLRAGVELAVVELPAGELDDDLIPEWSLREES